MQSDITGLKARVVRLLKYGSRVCHVLTLLSDMMLCTIVSLSLILFAIQCCVYSSFTCCRLQGHPYPPTSMILVGFRPYLQDRLVSFSALTLLVWSYDL